VDAAIDPSIILPDWSESDRAELLQRPLFGFASYGRVRFHHRSASEFLAAQRLRRLSADGHMPRAALFRLLFGECYGQDLVFLCVQSRLGLRSQMTLCATRWCAENLKP
jgi:hypothetical protein